MSQRVGQKKAHAESIWHRPQPFLERIDLELVDTLVEAMRQGVPGGYPPLQICERRRKFRLVKASFQGDMAVTWLVGAWRFFDATVSRSDCVKFFQRLLQERVIVHYCQNSIFEDRETLYRFQQDEDIKVLNHCRIWYSDSRNSSPNSKPSDESKMGLNPNVQFSKLLPVPKPFELSVNLLKALKNCFEKVSSTSGSHRDGFAHTGHICSHNIRLVKNNPLYEQVRVQTSHLQRADLSVLTPPQLTCFFINIFNLLVMHMCVASSENMGFQLQMQTYSDAIYDIGGFLFSAADLHHRIIRAARPHKPLPVASSTFAFMTTSNMEAQRFPKSDPRRGFVNSMWDARYNFALCTGNISGPALAVFDEDNTESIEKLLDATTRMYFAQNVYLTTTTAANGDISAAVLWAPKLFDVLYQDFAFWDDAANPRRKASSILNWIFPYLPLDDQLLLMNLLNSDRVEVRYPRASSVRM